LSSMGLFSSLWLKPHHQEMRPFPSENQLTCFPAAYGALSLQSLVSQVNSCCWVPLWISSNNSDRVSLRRQLNYFAARAGCLWVFLSLWPPWIDFSCFREFGSHVNWHSLREMPFGNFRYCNLTKIMYWLAKCREKQNFIKYN
jgi:hypothetical protein